MISCLFPGLILTRGNLTKQSLSSWVVEAIAFAYMGQGLQPPALLRAHLTRGLAASWALLRAVSVQYVFAAVSWSSLLTFVCLKMLDVSAPMRMVLDSLLKQGDPPAGWWTLDKLAWQFGNYHIP